MPNTLPAKPVPSVITEPFANTNAPASAAVRRCAAAVTAMLPPTCAVAPVATAIVSALAPLSVSVEPAPTFRSVPVPPATVSVCAVAGCSATLVLFDTVSWPIVCVVTPVAVTVPPPLKNSWSSVAGVLRVGVQFVDVANDALPVALHVY